MNSFAAKTFCSLITCSTYNPIKSFVKNHKFIIRISKRKITSHTSPYHYSQGSKSQHSSLTDISHSQKGKQYIKTITTNPKNYIIEPNSNPVNVYIRSDVISHRNALSLQNEALFLGINFCTELEISVHNFTFTLNAISL